jgi:hypothetical protein
LALLAIALTVPVGAAHATILTGAFSVLVYQGPGNGNINHPNNQANEANPLLLTMPLYSGTYTGNIDFNAPSNNVLAFLLSAGGSLSGDTSALNTTLSTSNFALTTVFDIKCRGNRLAGTIEHDDKSLYLMEYGVDSSSTVPIRRHSG